MDREPTYKEFEPGIRDLERKIDKSKINEELNKEWSTVFDTMADFVSLHDNDYRFVNVNKALSDYLDMNPDDIIGSQCYKLLHGTDEPLTNCPHTKVLEIKQPVAEEVIGPDIGCSWLASATPVFAANGEIIGSVHIIKEDGKIKQAEMIQAICPHNLEELVKKCTGELIRFSENLRRDISEHKHVEEALKVKQRAIEEQNARLEELVNEEAEENRRKDMIIIHQSRLAAVGEMIGNIAHQWRQPLNALNILLYNIKDYYADEEINEEDLDALIATGDRLIKKMSTTIDDFRNFLKLDKQKEEFCVNNIIRESLSLVNASFNYHHISTFLNEEDNLTVFGFPNEYSQVILNILNNAKDAILERKVSGDIVIDTFREFDSAVVKIRDNGGGICEKVFPQIFAPYFTTKEQGEGTGMGLYICKEIIENHINGTIEARNTTEGAEFKIITPIVDKKIQI